LLRLLAERERLDLIDDLGRAYDALLDRELGRLRIVVRSAVDLGDEDRARVIDVARRLTGQTNIVATVVVEPELLGGVLIDVRGTIYDGTVRTQLERLGREMVEQQ
jgi:F-type H+-transporting ATPase subunit delta